MSLATKWVAGGAIPLIVGAIMAAAGLNEGTAGLVVAGVVVGMGGAFVIQVGVIALGVEIGTHGQRRGLSGGVAPATKKGPQVSHLPGRKV
jgi:hypothetical protein